MQAYLSVCDVNYQRLLRLIPHLRDGSLGELVFTDSSRRTIKFRFVEHHRYTSILKITQKASQGTKTLSLTVRVYHDLLTTEVVEFQNQRRFDSIYGYPNPTMRLPNEKEQVNVFLGEILLFCIEQQRNFASREIPGVMLAG